MINTNGGKIKMKILLSKIGVILLLGSLLASCVTATQLAGCNPRNEPPIEWSYTYGGEKIDWGHCIEQTVDGGYIITGALGRNAFMPWRGDVYMLKIDRDGQEQWHQTHGIAYNENVGRSIQQTSDGGYIIAGYTGYTYHIDGYLIKTDELGNVSWATVLGNFNYYDNLQSATQTTDGGYIATGWTGSYGAGGADVWLIKVDSNGVEEWNHTFGGTGLDGGNHVEQTTDGGFIVTGLIEEPIGDTNLFLLKTDADGNEEWSQIYGDAQYEEGSCLHQTDDGGYIITGYTTSQGAGEGDVWLIKTFDDGTIDWDYCYGGTANDIGHSVEQTSDGGYFIAAEYTNPATLITDMYLIKTDGNGVEEWSDIIDNDGAEDVANDGIQTNDLGYIVVGSTGVYSDELVDVIVLKYQGTNQAPFEPSNPSPSDGATAVSINTDISWTGGDPDNDSVTYDVYFGITPTPEKIAEGLTETLFDLPSSLTYSTTYYWMIRATDTYGSYTDGPVWSFTTQNELPALEIGSITGSTIVTAIIHNNGSGRATNVTWGIYISGGLFGFLRKSFGGLIPSIEPGDNATVTSKIFLGFGKIKVNVFASCDQVQTPIGRTVYGTMFFIWLKI
jgi:hypothetical protein